MSTPITWPKSTTAPNRAPAPEIWPPADTVPPTATASAARFRTPLLITVVALAPPPATTCSSPPSDVDTVAPPLSTVAVSPGSRINPLLTVPEDITYAVKGLSPWRAGVRY